MLKHFDHGWAVCCKDCKCKLTPVYPEKRVAQKQMRDGYEYRCPECASADRIEEQGIIV